MTTHIPFKPVFIKDDKELQILLKKNPHLSFVDAFEHQVKELFFIENHSYIGTPKKEAYNTDFFSNYRNKYATAYVYAYFPWNHTIVKTVKKPKYLELKTNRNRDLITSSDQEKFRNFKVGVLGMSVGSNIAFVLTQAGISNEVTVADFDELDTTNLNRILAGVHQVGINKTVVAARKIYEDNPFASVRLLQKGVSEKILDKLLKERKLDCIVEEVDNLPMKITTRLLAMKYKVPVIMLTDNGDGVVLHVERYDKGLKTIFDKPVSYWEEFMKGPLDKQKMGKMIIEDIFGGPQNAAPGVIESVHKVFAKEIVSWPQLGSAALLGGVVGTIMIKRIVRGEEMPLSLTQHIQL